MAQAFEEQLQRTDLNDLSFDDRLAFLVEREHAVRSIYRKIKNRFLVVRRVRAPVLGFCAREEHRSRPWISPSPDSRGRRRFPA